MTVLHENHIGERTRRYVVPFFILFPRFTGPDFVDFLLHSPLQIRAMLYFSHPPILTFPLLGYTPYTWFIKCTYSWVMNILLASLEHTCTQKYVDAGLIEVGRH